MILLTATMGPSGLSNNLKKLIRLPIIVIRKTTRPKVLKEKLACLGLAAQRMPQVDQVWFELTIHLLKAMLNPS